MNLAAFIEFFTASDGLLQIELKVNVENIHFSRLFKGFQVEFCFCIGKR